MIPLSIGSATEVYGDASQCEITRHWVDHPALADSPVRSALLSSHWEMRPRMSIGGIPSAPSADSLLLSAPHHCHSLTLLP